jgi:hypothetical protein
VNPYREKLLSISAPRRLGASERTVERTGKSTVISDEHWDGRRDATVRPDPVRYGGRVHSTGRRKGEVAEVAPMSDKEARHRYGR